MKWAWNCISWNALTEKFHSVSLLLEALLFMIFINYLHNSVKSTTIYHFPNDASLLYYKKVINPFMTEAVII